jgi:hypothetical protein
MSCDRRYVRRSGANATLSAATGTHVSDRQTCRAGTSLGRSHRSYQRASVQLSENARAQVLNGFPSRWVGNGRPFA